MVYDLDSKRDLNILIVDDDELVLKTITKILQSSNPRYFIQTATCVAATLDLVRQTYWDTILLDISLPYGQGGAPDTSNGLRALDVLNNDYKVTAPIIAITGHQDGELSEKVLDKGAYYFLNKPVQANSLSAIVKNATKFQMAGYDGLTGLLSRGTFEERLKSEFERVRRRNVESEDDGRSYLSLIFIDGDNFKEINDTYSHLVGDHVLKLISSSFTEQNIYRSLGANDVKYIIRPYDIAARFGGDEFLLFLPEADHPSAVNVARRIKKYIESINVDEIAGGDFSPKKTIDSFSISIGIATYPYPNEVNNHEDLIRMADNAMYSSKETRRGDIFGYDGAGGGPVFMG